MAAGGPGTLPLLRPRGLVSMTTPTANWPELLKAVVLEVLGQPADPGVRYAGTGRETRGRPSVHLEHPKERAGDILQPLQHLSIPGTGLSRLPRDPGAENGAERNGHQEHNRPDGRRRRGRRRIVAGDRRGRETIHGGSKIHRGKIPEPPQGNLGGFGFALVERFDWTEALTRRDLRIENEERWIWTNSTQSRRFCRIVSRLRWIAKQIREIDFKEVCSCNNGWRS